MAEWLLLRLPRAADEPAEWLVCDAQGFAAGTTQRGTLGEAAAVLEELEETARVWALAGRDVSPLPEARLAELHTVFGARW